MTVTRNRVVCLGCGKILESKHVHDFQQCSCPLETFCDGGQDYQRVGGVDFSMIRILTEDGQELPMPCFSCEDKE
jgi:hypothetical protein